MNEDEEKEKKKAEFVKLVLAAVKKSNLGDPVDVPDIRQRWEAALTAFPGVPTTTTTTTTTVDETKLKETK